MLWETTFYVSAGFRGPSCLSQPLLQASAPDSLLTCLHVPPSGVLQNRTRPCPLFPGSLHPLSTTRPALLSALRPPLPPSEEETPLWHLGQGRGRGHTWAALCPQNVQLQSLGQQVYLTWSQGGGKSISVITPSSVWKPQMSTQKAKLQSLQGERVSVASSSF